MDNSKEVNLPSGSTLKITPGSFDESKELLRVVMEEAKSLKLDMSQEVDFNLFKDIFCVGFSSKKIESALAPCLKRCLIDGLKIDKDTFEAIEKRQDYLEVLFEVAQENIAPFTKSLYAKFGAIMARVAKATQA